MLDRKEISEFKKRHYSLEKRIGKIGRKQCASVTMLSKALKDIIDNIESTIERDKELWNPDISTKVKLAKRSLKLSKKLKYFEGDVVREFEAGNISQDIGKRFIAVIKDFKNNKKKDANRKFAYLLDIMELNRDYEESKQEMEKKEDLLRKKQQKIIALLEEFSRVENATIDEHKVRRYVEFLGDMKKLEKARADYLSSLGSKPMKELIGQAESLEDYFGDMPGEMKEIRKFFSDYPKLGNYKIGQLCEMFGFNEKKLSHVCQETTRFRNVIAENRNWFEMLRDIEHKKFLEPDDEKSLEFYSKNGLGKTVERIRSFKKDMASCKNEYEGKMGLEKKRKELSKHSKKDLEAELKETESLIEFLHAKPEIEEDLFSRISAFFRS